MLHQSQGRARVSMLGTKARAAPSDEAVVQRAAEAADLEALEALRQGLRAAMARRFVDSTGEVRRERDAVLRLMGRRSCAGLAPEAFAAPRGELSRQPIRTVAAAVFAPRRLR